MQGHMCPAHSHRDPVAAGQGAVARQGHPSPLPQPVATHVSSLDDEVPGLPVPQHAEHVLLLALALPHQKVPAVAQQLLHLRARDGPVVPDLLAQRLLHLRDQGHGGRQLDGDQGEPSLTPGSCRSGGAGQGGPGAGEEKAEGARGLSKAADGDAQELTEYLGLKMPVMWFLRVSSAVAALRSCSCRKM